MNDYDPFFNLNQGKIIIVIAPPGSGGNHLANILASSNGIWLHHNLDLLEKYKLSESQSKFNVNVFDFMNHRHNLDIVIDLVRNRGQNAVFSFHAYELLAHCYDDLLNKLDPIIWLVNMLPDHDSIDRHPCLQRVVTHNDMHPNLSTEMIQELVSIYKPQNLSKIYPGYWVGFHAENLWCDDGAIICATLTNLLPIKFDQRKIDTCKKMHQNWLVQIKYQIENYALNYLK
jgi:hypothetical protein